MAGYDRESDVASQFVVHTEGDRCSVTFNGVKVENVKRVSITNDFDADDVVRSSITIDLIGEPVLTKNTART